MVLRDYQERGAKKVMREFSEVNSTAVVWPTGCGKTTLFCEIIRRFQPNRAIVVAERRELIWQARERIESVGISCAIEMGELDASVELFAPVIICTVQTLIASDGNGGRRMGKFDPMQFGLLVVDEMHHSTAQSYRDVINYFSQNPDLRILGVTATPDRTDEEALGQIFKTVADDYEILDAIKDGWLVGVEQVLKTVKGLDFTEMRTQAGDLNQSDLSKELERESNVHGMVQPLLETMFNLPDHALDATPTPQWGDYIATLGSKPMRTLVFACSVAQSEMMANIFNRVRPGLAAWISGTTPDDVRIERLQKFKTGDCPVMVNCQVLIEGYDNPELQLVGMARPTKSRARYAQMIGRALRTLPGIVDGIETADGRRTAIEASDKKFCRVVDFAGNAGRHKLVTSLDILGGKVSENAIARAVKMAEKLGRPVKAVELLEEAEEDLKREAEEARQREEARKSRMLAKVKYSSRIVNPFDVLDLTPARSRGWDEGKRLSEGHRRILVQQGIDPDSMSYCQGRQIVMEIFRRWKSQLCSFGQAKILKQRNLATDVSKQEASRMITEIAAKEGWKSRPARVSA